LRFRFGGGDGTALSTRPGRAGGLDRADVAARSALRIE